MDRIKVRFTLPPAFNGHKPGTLQFTDKFGHARPAHAHVLSQTILPRKTRIIVPGVAQEHGVGDLCTDGKGWVFEDEIGDLREATPDDWIVRGEMQVLLFEDFPDLFHLC